jgi:hypothetical protein
MIKIQNGKSIIYAHTAMAQCLERFYSAFIKFSRQEKKAHASLDYQAGKEITVFIECTSYLWKRMSVFFFAWRASASSSSKASSLSKALPEPGSSLNEGKILCKCSFA